MFGPFVLYNILEIVRAYEQIYFKTKDYSNITTGQK